MGAARGKFRKDLQKQKLWPEPKEALLRRVVLRRHNGELMVMELTEVAQASNPSRIPLT